MANKFDLEKYLRENKILAQSGRSLISEARPTGFGTGTGRSKTVAKGGEGNPEVIAKLKAKEKEEEEKLEKVKQARKFKMINGVPHKFKDGKYVPLKKVNEADRVAYVAEIPGSAFSAKYFESFEDAEKFVDETDPEGMMNYNIRKIEGSDDKELEGAMDAGPGEGGVMEAKKDEEEEVEDIDIEDEEMNMEEPVGDEPVMGDEISDEQQELQKQLTQAYNTALKMGDEKLTTQLSNTITYYLKTLF